MDQTQDELQPPSEEVQRQLEELEDFLKDNSKGKGMIDVASRRHTKQTLFVSREPQTLTITFDGLTQDVDYYS